MDRDGYCWFEGRNDDLAIPQAKLSSLPFSREREVTWKSLFFSSSYRLSPMKLKVTLLSTQLSWSLLWSAAQTPPGESSRVQPRTLPPGSVPMSPAE